MRVRVPPDARVLIATKHKPKNFSVLTLFFPNPVAEPQEISGKVMTSNGSVPVEKDGIGLFCLPIPLFKFAQELQVAALVSSGWHATVTLLLPTRINPTVVIVGC